MGDLAAYQGARGDEVHVLTATPASDEAGVRRFHSTERVGAVFVHRNAVRWMLGVPHNPLGRARTTRLMRKLRPDVVHLHFGVVSPFAWDGLAVVRTLGLPALVTWHCMVDGAMSAAIVRAAAGWGGWGKARVELSAVSHAAADRVARAIRRPVAVLPNAIDVAAWVPADVGESLEHGSASQERSPLRVVATQRLATRKRPAALVEVVAQATARANAPIDLTVVGSGPGKASVLRAARAAGLESRVHLIGRVPRTELKSVYADHDVFLSTTRLEAFGLAALEARATGLPVLARADNGIGEFITDGQDGVLAESDEALAAALGRLAEDREEWQRLRQYALDHPPIHDWDHVYATAVGLYAAARRER